MAVLQDLFDREVGKVPLRVTTDLITRKIEAHGITLTSKERDKLQRAIKKGTKFSLRRPSQSHQDVNIEIDSADFEELKQRTARFIEKLDSVCDNISESVSEKLFGRLYSDWPAYSKQQRRNIQGFVARLQKRWGKALSELRMMTTLAHDFGDMHAKHLRQSTASKEAPTLVDVLTRLHARGCRIAREVLCLLESGFADGALARWRTLHEVTVIATFIQKNGEHIAERYVEHQAIEASKAAKEYEACYKQLGYEPLSVLDIKKIEDRKAAAISKYGSGFGKQYGWASNYVNGEPTFRTIEAAAKLDYLRSHYKMASHPVHGNAQGIFFQLGMIRETSMLMAGPSNSGLSEPGQSTGLSILQLSGATASLQPTLDSIVAVKIMQLLQAQLAASFADVENALEQEEAAFASAARPLTS